MMNEKERREIIDSLSLNELVDLQSCTSERQKDAYLRSVLERRKAREAQAEEEDETAED